MVLKRPKLLMSLWFDGSQKNESYSVYQSLPFIEKGLVCLKPSNYTSRVPRTIKGNLGYRKASEFRSFLLHYFVPVIPQLLPPIYFEHYYLLSHAVHLLLNQTSLCSDDKTAEVLFHKNRTKLFNTHSGRSKHYRKCS